MGWQSLGGIVSFPEYAPDTGSGALAYTSSTLLIDAAGEKAAFIINCHKAGTVTTVGWRTATVTTGDTVDVRLEQIDGTTGDPSGTLWGTNTNGSQVVANADDNVWFNTALTSNATVAQGDRLAVVIANGSGGGNMQIAAFNIPTQIGFPYCDLLAGAGPSWTKSVNMPCCALKLNDNTYVHLGQVWPLSNIASVSVNTGTTPDEIGNVITPPITMRCVGVWAYFATAATSRDYQVIIYDTDGTTALATITGDANLASVVTVQYHAWATASSLTLKAGSQYRVVLKPTTASSNQIQAMTVSDAAMLDVMSGGQNCHRTERTDAGSWSQTTTQRVCIGLLIDAIDDGFAGRQVKQVGCGTFPIY